MQHAGYTTNAQKPYKYTGLYRLFFVSSLDRFSFTRKRHPKSARKYKNSLSLVHFFFLFFFFSLIIRVSRPYIIPFDNTHTESFKANLDFLSLNLHLLYKNSTLTFLFLSAFNFTCYNTMGVYYKPPFFFFA